MGLGTSRRLAVRNLASDSLLWASSDSNHARVDQTGLIRAVRLGTTVISASQRDDPGRTAAASLTVVNDGLICCGRIASLSISTLNDARGRWLFDPRHTEARSEYAVTGVHDGTASHVVLDRTFVDNAGVRWVVDFKLSRHEGTGREAFLDSEQARYRAQLDAYADVVRGLGPQPIRLGLYFPLLAGWRQWDAKV
jgi:hypothetical protein